MNAKKLFYSKSEYKKAKKYLEHIHNTNKNLPNNYQKYVDDMRPKEDLEREANRTRVVSAVPIIATNSIVRATTHHGLNIKPPAIGRSTSIVSDLLGTASDFDSKKKNMEARKIAKAKNLIDRYHEELKREKMKG